MDFSDRLQDLASKIEARAAVTCTEEATKNALIMPFIQCLGYNPFEPTEVVPEFVADIGEKKGEKVDYAIFKDGKPIVLFECKPCMSELRVEHALQLQRYFNFLVDVRFAVLTNGLTYLFFSDLDHANVMDKKPFLEVSMLQLDESDIEQLKQFTKDAYDEVSIVTAAGDLKRTKEVLQSLKDEYRLPTEDFVRFFARRVYSGKITDRVLDLFRPVVKKAFQQFVSSMISETLNRARMLQDESTAEEAHQNENSEGAVEDDDRRILTTELEWQAYFIVKAILVGVVDISRIAMRDRQSYCGILLDNNNRKPLCRLWFNVPERLSVGLFDGANGETRIPIKSVEDLYGLADRLKTTAALYDKGKD